VTFNFTPLFRVVNPKRIGPGRRLLAVSTLILGKEVTLQTFGEDRYGRTIADVLLPDGTNVTHALVKDSAGWCRWYRKYAPDNPELERLEQAAREAKNRLWADHQPVPPWEYRTLRRGQ
jgi:micrococcal nuclease